MPESSPPDPSDHSPITDEELWLTLDAKLNSWDFKQHTESENVRFAHNISSLVSDNFNYLNYAGSEVFSAEELPGTLHPLFSTIWSPGGVSQVVMARDVRVHRVKRREEHTEITPYIPGFDEMIDSGMTFAQIVNKLRSDPNLQGKIVPGTTIVDEAILLVLSRESSSRGFEFTVEPDNISLSIFGSVGETRDLSEFLAHYHSNQSELAKISASLAVLAAKYCLRPHHYETSELKLTELDKKFLSGF
jgi:hypothetical protein